ncbi:MAG TPA: bifunctional 4-hydroxy-2-oxoglutarate aldolase/2-dehydro-3-deoxy-phosphogluconate aldolase [Kiritimatiellia bacterium]|nr:bifunctional 4-hydroxy-2-oxoglutarate aldolase/2-dehydro-3-deoxy-phosphogluconate aldolase [Kiritimatiellia bacterium]
MQEILDQRVVPVAVIERVEDAVPVAKALIAGGLTTLELTLRTPAALECLIAIRRDVPEMKVGAGTVLTSEQVRKVAEAGAYFAVAPGLNPRIVALAKVRKLPFYPGVMTPSDVEHGLELGCTLQKFFPAEAAGGLNMIKALAGPYAHTGLKLIPLGGVTAQNMKEYLANPLVAAVGGSWLVDKKLVAAKDWSGITALAREAATLAKS